MVKDAANLAQVIVRELETAGYQTVHAADGVAALKLHARHPRAAAHKSLRLCSGLDDRIVV